MHIVAALFLGAAVGAASPPSLVHLDADYGPVENGKRLKMEFQELKRDGSESTVRAVFYSGGSVSSSMFILSGHCAIAKSRGAKFFRQVSETETSRGVWIYTVAFANTSDAPSLKTPKPSSRATEDEDADDVFSKSDCRMLGFW